MYALPSDKTPQQVTAMEQVPVRKHYPSDVRDEQWAPIEPVIAIDRGRRSNEVDLREVVNTIRSLDRTGCERCMLPHDLLPKSVL